MSKWNLEFFRPFRERLEQQLKENSEEYKRCFVNYDKDKKLMAGIQRPATDKEIDTEPN